MSFTIRRQLCVRRPSRSYEQCTVPTLRVNPQVHPQRVKGNNAFTSASYPQSPPSTPPTPIPTTTTVLLYATHFRRRANRLDHHRVITFENLSYKAVICEAILNFAICEREDRSSLIGKHSTTAFFQQDDISLGVRWKKQRGIDLIDRLSKEIECLLHEKTSVRSHDSSRLRISSADFFVTENPSRSASVAAPDSRTNDTPS